MEKDIVILTKSKKMAGYCVAGIDLQTGRFIRLISEANSYGRHNTSLSESDLLYSDGSPIEVLDIVRLRVDKPAPCGYRSENFAIDVFATKTKTGRFSLAQLRPYLSEEEYIYSNLCHKLHKTTEVDGVLTKSIGVFKIKSLHTYFNANNKMRADFIYNGNTYKNVAITDLEFLDKPKKIREAIIIVSLSEPFSNETNPELFCYKIVAQVFDISNVNIEALMPNKDIEKKILELEDNLQKLKPYVDAYESTKSELKHLLIEQFSSSQTSKYAGNMFSYSYVPAKIIKRLDPSKVKDVLGSRYDECLQDVVYKENVTLRSRFTL